MLSSRKKSGSMVMTLALGLALLSPAGEAQEDPNAGQRRSVRAVDSLLWKELGYDKAKWGPLGDRLVSVLSEENLRALASGVDPAEIVTLSGRPLGVEIDALGSTADEMVYTPVTPCRLIDTRLAGGTLAAGETRNYDLVGPDDYSSLGGNAAGCNIPTTFGGGPISFNTVRALVVNLVAVTPLGTGNLRAWPTNQVEPLAAVINYTTGLNLANGVLLQTCTTSCFDVVPPFTCGNPCPSGDLTIRAAAAGTDLVVDVLGYFTAATTSGVGGRSVEDTGGSVSLSAGTCVNAASVNIANSSSSTVGIVCTANASLGISHTNGTSSQTSILITNTNATTCDTSVSPQPGAATWEIPAAFPTAGETDHTVSATKRFTLAGGASDTYFLNVQAWSGAGALDFVDSSVIDCIVDP